jgi:hypothetical protein
VISVLSPSGGVGSDRLSVSIWPGTDPHFLPGWWNGQTGDSIQHFSF